VLKLEVRPGCCVAQEVRCAIRDAIPGYVRRLVVEFFPRFANAASPVRAGVPLDFYGNEAVPILTQQGNIDALWIFQIRPELFGDPLQRPTGRLEVERNSMLQVCLSAGHCWPHVQEGANVDDVAFCFPHARVDGENSWFGLLRGRMQDKRVLERLHRVPSRPWLLSIVWHCAPLRSYVFDRFPRSPIPNPR